MLVFEVTADIILATGPQNTCTRESAMGKMGKMRFLRLFLKSLSAFQESLPS